ncbi:TadE/TadG family type IV pilus assembly protein [Ferrimonas sp. SCSIO 43195]|uniref:TadE/TadG family type IV pilus assembly protein n=1 Tax=Ferrimonas sp. SCSIO 43195 TaxID=2822844 RepID=UPI0020760FF0|nr:TadE/TadG family type IV pilus assembly protein [Ferrimonas sp. SCSIO 43195]USD36512.1 pilus assembly protein [Ferrimonas sp. SCSIO 43195]
MNHKNQRGVYAVEFAIVATVVFVIIFACLEVSRLMFAYNVLTEASRRAARLATVCAPDTSGNPTAPVALQSLALFDGANFGPAITNANLNIEYLTLAGVTATSFYDIALVRASITNYQHTFVVPGITLQINSPDFVTTLPRESLGATRFGTTVCI